MSPLSGPARRRKPGQCGANLFTKLFAFAGGNAEGIEAHAIMDAEQRLQDVLQAGHARVSHGALKQFTQRFA
jgi:hypothetical protein